MIFNKFYDGEYGYSDDVRYMMHELSKGRGLYVTEFIYLPTSDLKVSYNYEYTVDTLGHDIHIVLKEAKAREDGKRKAQEECKTQDEALLKYWVLGRESL